MSVTVEQNSAVERRLTITIPGTSIESEVERRLGEYGKQARIKGFRPGKAPANIVRREYGATVRGDVLEDMMRQHYADALTSEALEPVAVPRFETVATDANGDFTFAAEVEVYPEVEPRGVDALELKRPEIEISEQDVDTVLERLRVQRGEWAAAERPAAIGDRVTVNFEGLVEGEPFAGNHGEQVPVVLGAGEMIPGFESGLEGISAGETRRLALEFPGDYRVGELAGRAAVFEVAATAVEARRVPDLNDEFAAGFGCADIAELRERVRGNMGEELETRIGDYLRRQVSDQLVAANPLELPAALVNREVERRQREILRRLGIKSDDARTPQLPREPYVEAAERQVRLGLILHALIEREALRPDPARVERHIEALCENLDDPAAGAREIRANGDAMRNIEALVLEDATYDWLIEQAAMNPEPMDFLAFMEPDREETATADADTEKTDE